MKRTSPMKMKIKGPVKTGTSAMEMYAGKRNKALKSSIKPPSINIIHETMREMHDPKYDMDTLMRAAEIKANKPRHKAAKTAAHQSLTRLQGVVKET